MAYIVPADFYETTLAEYCSGLVLTPPAVGGDTAVATAITEFSKQFDNWTHDHFESETLTLELDGEGSSIRLYLPRRCTAITTVKTRDFAGSLTTQTGSVYRLRSSLDTAGAQRLYGDLDWIDIVMFGTGLSNTLDGPYVWPKGPNAVEVAGTFGWTTCPTDVKRAVALLVYNRFKPQSDALRQAQSWSTETASFRRPEKSLSGLVEVDGLIEAYTRDTEVLLG